MAELREARIKPAEPAAPPELVDNLIHLQGDAINAAKESGRWESDAAVVIGLFAAGDLTDPATGKAGRHKAVWALVDKNRWAGNLGLVALKYDGMRCAFEDHDPDDMPAPAKDPEKKDEVLDQRIREAVTKHDLTTLTQVVGACKGNRTALLDRARFLIATTLTKDEKGCFRWPDM